MAAPYEELMQLLRQRQGGQQGSSTGSPNRPPDRGFVKPTNTANESIYGNSQGQRWYEYGDGPPGFPYPGMQSSHMVGPGYGAPNPGLGDGSRQRGQVQLGPNPPSPGLGMGAPFPGQYEDQTFGYQNAGQNQDPLLAMIAALLNQRFPNNG